MRFETPLAPEFLLIKDCIRGIAKPFLGCKETKVFFFNVIKVLIIFIWQNFTPFSDENAQ